MEDTKALTFHPILILINSTKFAKRLLRHRPRFLRHVD
jgi:hypothetical protein